MSHGDPRRVLDYLGHILQAIDNILEYTAGATLKGYLADRKTQDAVVRNLEVIGEASNNVDTRLKQCGTALDRQLFTHACPDAFC